MLTLEKLSSFYLDYQRTYNKPNSVASCDYTLRLMLGLWGSEREVSSVTAVDLEAFVGHQRKRGLKPVSINKDMRVIRGMLNYGVNNGLLERAPFKVRMLKAPRKRELNILTREEIQRLVDAAKNPYKSIILIAASTGMRLSEVLNLTWGDVVFAENRLTVTAKKGWSPKSHQSRSVPVGEKLLLVFRNLFQKSRYQEREDFVFSTRRRTSINPHNASRNLKLVWKRAGLHREGMPTLHHLRHNAASQMLNSGASLETVRDILGHSTISVTALYCHSNTELKKKATQVLEM